MIDAPTLEVRCCCNAGRLLGYLEVEPHLIRHGEPLTYAVMPRLRGPHVEDGSAPSEKAGRDVLTLHVWRLLTRDDFDEPVLAIRSDDYPIEYLRQIPGFREATWQDRARAAGVPLEGR